jgi:hypothetical protein
VLQLGLHSPTNNIKLISFGCINYEIKHYQRNTTLILKKCADSSTYQIININRTITRSSVDVLLAGAATSDNQIGETLAIIST